MVDNQKFRILSLDGGGVRGYLSIGILENIEHFLNINDSENENMAIGMRFDLIAGTSTGSIIAALLAKGLTAREVKSIYISSMKKVFKKRSTIKRLFQSQYSSDELKNIVMNELKDKRNNGQMNFNELERDLIITAFDLEKFMPKIFKSNFSTKNHKNYYISDAIMSSTAAPSFFPVYEDVANDHGVYIDGGVSANNPALVALIDAKHFDRDSKRGISPVKSLESISLLSVGTGKYRMKLNLKGLKNAPKWDWAISLAKKTSPIKDVLFASQEEIEESKVRLLSESENIFYTRINPDLRKPIELDDVDKMDLLDEYTGIKAYESELKKMLLDGDKL